MKNDATASSTRRLLHAQGAGNAYTEGKKFASLNMIRSDLQFALDCLQEAKKLGQPFSENKSLKALIFAGVTS
jgi:hypothetical protein